MNDVNGYKELAMLFGRTLGKVGLYGVEHPAIGRSIEQLQTSVESILEGEAELTLASSEGNLLVNSIIVDGEAHLAGVLSSLGLDSITIVRGVGREDLAGLLKSFNPGDTESVEAALIKEGVRNIKVNLIHYVKSGEEGGALEGDSQGFTESMEGLTFESMLWKVIDRAVPGEEDKRKVYELVMKRFGDEVSGKIDDATRELEDEKEAVIREKEKAETVIGSSVQGLITVDNEGSVVMMNPEGEGVVGAPLRKIAGRPVWEDLKEGHMVTLAKDGKGAFTINDVVVEGEDETKRLIRASNAMIRNIEGKMVGIFSALSDVTKYKELERMKKDFAASVTHELRTPIVATKQALTNVLTLASDIDEDQKKMIEISLRNTERLLRLVNDILDFSKLDAGRMKITPEMVETGPFLKEVVSSLAPFAESTGVELLLKDRGALPRLFVDRDRTTQVLTNLLSNAIKFTEANGSVSVEISGMLKQGADTLLRISVRDTGRGIAEEDLGKIFEKFVQVGSGDSTSLKGTGLGLSITKAMVELHGGRIDVESELGVGTVFTVAMPMLPEDEVFLKEKGNDPKAAPTGSPLEGVGLTDG